MAQKIQIRRDTAAALSAIILDAGELGYQTDTKLLFMGDGVTAGGNLVFGAPDGPLSKHGNAALGNGVQSLAIAFTTAFSGAPRCIQVTLGVPHLGALILIGVDVSLITAAGFTVLLDAATPNGNYFIHWSAKL